MFRLLLLSSIFYFSAKVWAQECELALFMERDRVLPGFAFIGHEYDIDLCRNMSIESGGACRQSIEEGVCDLTAASECEFQARCCWFAFWDLYDLTDPKPETDPEITWGQYFCDQAWAELGGGDAYTLLTDGRWRHCGKDRPNNWETIEDSLNFTSPVICCDQLGGFVEGCSIKHKTVSQKLYDN